MKLPIWLGAQVVQFIQTQPKHFGMYMIPIFVVFQNYNLITSTKMMRALRSKLFKFWPRLLPSPIILMCTMILVRSVWR